MWTNINFCKKWVQYMFSRKSI